MKTTTLVKQLVLRDAKTAICEKCHGVFPSKDLTVHHIVPLRYTKMIREHYGVQDMFSGIQKYGILCRSCHDEIEEINRLFNALSIATIVHKVNRMHSGNKNKPEHKIKLQIYDHYRNCGIKVDDDSFYKNLLEVSMYYKRIYGYFLENKIKGMLK